MWLVGGFMIIKIIKRDGREVPFNIEKIADAIFKAARAVGGQDYHTSLKLAEKVVIEVEKNHKDTIATVENIQDLVEKVLIEEGHAKTAKEYILYRAERNKFRQMDTRLMRKFEKIFIDGKSSYRGNPNKVILEYATESTKEFYDLFFLNKEHIHSHRVGDIYIHSLEYLAIMTNSIQMDLTRILKDGYFDKTRNILGNDILSVGKKVFLALEENQQDQIGFQSIPNFEEIMKVGVIDSFKTEYRRYFNIACELIIDDIDLKGNIENIFKVLESNYEMIPRLDNKNYLIQEKKYLNELMEDTYMVDKIQAFANEKAYEETARKTYETMKNLIYDLNNIRCNRGGSIIKASINYGTDRSKEGRLVISSILDASRDIILSGYKLESPKQIFKIKDGVNLNKDDRNRDLLDKALNLNKYTDILKYSILDTSYNIKDYNKNDLKSEVAYDFENIRVYENLNNEKLKGSFKRGNLSITTLNLPRLALESKTEEEFFKNLDYKVDLILAQLLERFEMQASKNSIDYPFLMGENIWLESNKIKAKDTIKEILKNGTLSLGFLGLFEATKELGKKTKSKNLGLKIVEYMKARTDDISQQYKMNFNLYGTESEKLGKYFIENDRKKFGLIKGITDKEFYTDSFYIETDDYMNKILEEAQYHPLVEGGHNLNIKIDFEDIDEIIDLIIFMKNKEIGLFNIEINKNS